MKRTHLIAVLAGIVAVAVFAADASAMYHPTIGRFTSRDPGPEGRVRVGTARPATASGFAPRDQYSDGMSLCQYVRSNPVRYADPDALIALDLPPEYEKRIADLFAEYNKLETIDTSADMHHHWVRGTGDHVRLGSNFLLAIKRTAGYEALRRRLADMALKQAPKTPNTTLTELVQFQDVERTCTAKHPLLNFVLLDQVDLEFAAAVGSFDLEAEAICAVWTTEVSDLPRERGFCQKSNGRGYLAIASCDVLFLMEDKFTFDTYKDFVSKHGSDAITKIMGGVKQGVDAFLAAVDMIGWMLNDVKYYSPPPDFLMYAYWREQPVWVEVRCCADE